MSATFGDNLFSGFDIWEDCLDFLTQVFLSRQAPEEDRSHIFRQSLTAGAEDWHYALECAESMHQANLHAGVANLNHNFLSCLPSADERTRGQKPKHESVWLETDRLINAAQALQEESRSLLGSHLTKPVSTTPIARGRQTKSVKKPHTSHFWAQTADECLEPGQGSTSKLVGRSHSRVGHLDSLLQPQKRRKVAATRRVPQITKPSVVHCAWHPAICLIQKVDALTKDEPSAPETVVRSGQTNTSPYFSTQQAKVEDRKTSPRRTPGGIVSCVPFPPLSAASFGIVEEKLAHEPFWLLVAITFLIKTSGKQAIPVFYQVKERFPTPSHLGDPDNAAELTGMIQHLGLAAVRVKYLQKYAHAFIHVPPRRDIRYRVRNYDQRDNDAFFDDASADEDLEILKDDLQGTSEDAQAWEIGHMTQGKYALDSWRIFCRDELLGRALDWNGKGREPEFQPEWMRVMPSDKELRACLRWMWMREGWEWDPETGERTVLCEEMRRAVDEGRVEYDECGGLRMLDEPR